VLHVVVFIVSLAIFPNSWRGPDTAFPLLNHGASYAHQPWRPVTSLFTHVNSAFLMFNVFALASFIKHMEEYRTARLYGACVSAIMGAFAAGIAYPAGYFCNGFTTTWLLGLNAAMDPSTARNYRLVGGGVAVGCLCISITRYLEMLSLIVSLVFFVAHEGVLMGNHPRASAAAFMLGAAALAALCGTHTAVPVRMLAPQI
jgi:hypothetical protein